MTDQVANLLGWSTDQMYSHLLSQAILPSLLGFFFNAVIVIIVDKLNRLHQAGEYIRLGLH